MYPDLRERNAPINVDSLTGNISTSMRLKMLSYFIATKNIGQKSHFIKKRYASAI